MASEMIEVAKKLQDNKTFAHISQLAAGPLVLKTIDDFKKEHGEVPGLEAVYNTDVISLRRGLCLPAATCASLNAVYGTRKFNENSIAAMYRDLLPLHGAKAIDPATGEPYKNGWSIVTHEGDMYHHAIAYWVNMVTKGDVTVVPIINYDNLQDIAEIVGDTHTAVALSLDNKFVLDWVEKAQNDLKREFVIKNQNGIFFNDKKLGEKPFQNGRHVVALIDYRPNEALISDSFTLSGMTTEQTVQWRKIKDVETYTRYQSGVPSRAIVFTRDGQNHPNFKTAVSRFQVPVSVPILD